MINKVCRTCKKSLPLSAFKESKRTKDWFTLDCVECYNSKDRSHNHKYGKFSPWKKLDNWKRMKKRGRKTWTTFLKKTDIEIEIGTIVNYLTFWKNKIEDKINIAKWVKPNVPLSVWDAVREYWINPNTFYLHLNKYPELKAKYETLKLNMREYLKDTAESNMQRIIAEWDMTDKEKFDASFKVAQSTMREYNPKIEIEKRELKINLNKNSDDLKFDLAEILWVKIEQ